MSKFVGLLAVLAVLGGGAYLMLNNGSSTEVENEAAVIENEMPEAEQKVEGKGTLKNLLALNKNLTCEFSHVDEEGQTATNGVVFVAGERLRGEFTTASDGQEFTMQVLRDNEYAYSWGEGPMGTIATKIKLSAIEHSTDAQVKDPLEATEEVDYSCEEWVVEESLLTPPSDVEFTDLTEEVDAAAMSADMHAEMDAAMEAAAGAEAEVEAPQVQ